MAAVRAAPDAAPATPARVDADAAEAAFRPACDRSGVADVPARVTSGARLPPVSPSPARPGRPRTRTGALIAVAGNRDEHPAFGPPCAGMSAGALDDVNREPGRLPRQRRGLYVEASVEAHRATLPDRAARTSLHVLLAL